MLKCIHVVTRRIPMKLGFFCFSIRHAVATVAEGMTDKQ